MAVDYFHKFSLTLLSSIPKLAQRLRKCTFSRRLATTCYKYLNFVNQITSVTGGQISRWFHKSSFLPNWKRNTIFHIVWNKNGATQIFALYLFLSWPWQYRNTAKTSQVLIKSFLTYSIGIFIATKPFVDWHPV